MDNLNPIKEKLLSTSVTGWKNKLTTAILFILCSASVAAFGYILLGKPELQCHAVFFYLAIFWLAAEIAVIGYLYCYNNVPKFAREALILALLFANVWFILFVFSLQECAS